MSNLRTTAIVPTSDAATWTAPRSDVVREIETSPGRFEALAGPFRDYERTVTVTPVDDGRVEVDHHVRFRLALGVWNPIFTGPMRRVLRRPGSGPPWWAPPDVLDQRAARSLAALASLAIVAGYLGTLITQTLTFAAAEFGASDRAQGDTLAGVRIGVLLSMVVLAWADRHGRRRALLWSAALGCLATSLGALAPSMTALGATQTLARAMATALTLLILVVAAEEMPAGSRAYAVSLLAMTGALGAGVCLWILPIADVGPRAWRLLFVVPLLYLPLVLATARVLPESRRYVRHHGVARWRGHLGRLALLAGTGLLATIFTTPAAQLQNEYLRDEHSFSALQISVFTMVTATPGGLGIVAGGRLADVRGRKVVGALGLLGSVVFTVARFLSGGAWLWVWSILAAIAGGLTVPALSVYGPELFPTSLRSRANGVITVFAVAGSAIGLLAAGRLADRWSLGPGISVLAVGPAVVVALILLLYPETAHRELEDLNPEDAPTPRLDVTP